MKKLFAFIVLLSCMLGSRALAQNRAIMKPVTETIDFSIIKQSGDLGNNRLSWDNSHPRIDGQIVSERFTVQNTNEWGFRGSDVYAESYLQKNRNSSTSYVYLSDIKVGDVVTIWGEVGNTTSGAFNIPNNAELLNTTYTDNVTINGTPTTVPNSKEYRITGTDNGRVTIQFDGDWSGIRKITIQSQERETPHFDYDPGYEEYDMYDEFSQNDPNKEYNNGQQTGSSYHTSYTLSNEATGITLNGSTAQYIILSGSKNTANNRIAIDPSAGTWRFNYGLRAPNNGKWANFSICNLREGDRVVFSYTGTAPVFSSVAGGTTAPTEPYNGSNAFFDQYDDGTFDEGEDVYITSGATPETDWYRGEGNIYAEDHNGTYDDSPNVNPLRYTRYVITEDGHLDLAIAPDTRIVKIKIYSDHQASMVDEYTADSYTAKFDITGELQAMEHIVPGGLEVHVGDNDASQHAHVVTSAHGPVSIVNGVNGYKLPGMSLDENGNLLFEFDLANKIPETGTFYKFMPLEDGKMTITFQAASMNYYSYALNGDEVYYGDNGSYGDNGWSKQYDRPNEQTRGVTCPYYLVKVDARGNKTFTKIGDYFNGEEVTYEIPGEVKAEETYYLYGGWNATDLSFSGSGQGQNNLEYLPYGPGNGGTDKACGVAKLLEVVFNPNKKIYPLAKWVPNGTIAVKDDKDGKIGVPNPDTFETEYELAELWGYNDKTPITIKKMSGNITACHPYLKHVNGGGGPGHENHYKLMIDGIEYGDGDKGGTILIKIGDATEKSNPVYALTIAYSGDPTFDGNSGEGTRGHIWDYSSNALNGLKYEPSVIDHIHPGNIPVYTHNAATPEPYGHYFADYFAADISNYSSNDEVLEALPTSGTGLLYDEIAGGASDWMFNYNLVNAGKLYDPLFTNKYDLEGDNADLIWETEGMVLRTSANSSVMFNEFTGDDIHESEADPDRYVGILKGGEFRIPWLMPGDRVIIYMGTGKGAFNDQAVFNIRGAYDAVHNVIDPADDYIVGGSHWDGKNGDKNYRGCYHFFAQGHNDGPADMVFKMTSGSMCKIYSIQIYRGDRIITNEIVGKTDQDNFLLWSTAKDPNDANDLPTKGNPSNWTLQYFGKDQKLADNTNNVNNDIVAQTGHITKALTTDTDKESETYNSFTYPHDYGEIGTIRVRGKDMEKNMKYVADYGERNVTVAYQETQTYPYTGDFGSNVADYYTPEYNIGVTKPDDISDQQWSSIKDSYYEFTSRDLSLWEENDETDHFALRLNSQRQTQGDLKVKDNIFDTAKAKDGNQLWANGNVIPETQGLWFYTDNNNKNNGDWVISPNGMQLNGNRDWAHKVVVPNVPANAAVYLRLTPTKDNANLVYHFKDKDGNTDFEEGTDYSVYGPTQVNGTSEYIFAIKNKGAAKKHLILALGGYEMKKLAVSDYEKSLNKLGWATESRNNFIDPELTNFFTGEDIEVCKVVGFDYPNKTVTLERVTVSEKVMIPVNAGYEAYLLHNMKDEAVEILNGKFHLFVPDMHDYVEGNEDSNLKTIKNMEGSKLKAQLGAGTVPATDNAGNTNFVLTYKYRHVNANDEVTSGIIESDHVAFYRVLSSVSSKGNQGYLPVPTIDWHNQAAKTAKFTIIYIDDEEEDGGVVTGVENIESSSTEKATYYNLNGQKLNGAPTESGIYIRNGKKVLVKNI